MALSIVGTTCEGIPGDSHPSHVTLKCRERNTSISGFPFRLFDKPHFIARKPAHPALDLRLIHLDRNRFCGIGYRPVPCILHERLAIRHQHIEFDPIGSAIGTKIRFLLHGDIIRFGLHENVHFHHLTPRMPKFPKNDYFRKETGDGRRIEIHANHKSNRR